jgi:hypothetical protein
MTKQFVARTSRAVSPSTRSGSAFPLMWILKNFIDRIFTYRRHEGTDKSKYLQHSEMAEVRFTSRRVRFNVDAGSDLVTVGFSPRTHRNRAFMACRRTCTPKRQDEAFAEYSRTRRRAARWSQTPLAAAALPPVSLRAQ